MSKVLVRTEVTVGVEKFVQETNFTNDYLNIIEVSMTSAKLGALTTRTSASVGTLTMSSGHGIASLDTIDIYWDDANEIPANLTRHDVAVGTVSVNSVPISGGVGVDLPPQGTTIYACKVVTKTVSVSGDGDLVLLAVDSDCRPEGMGQMRINEAGPVLIKKVLIPKGSQLQVGSNIAPSSYLWSQVHSHDNFVDPISVGGNPATSVHCSHSNILRASKFRLLVAGR